MAEPRLVVEALTKVYQGGWGLHDVWLQLPAGCIVALGGPNGSGKSTFLRCLAGLARFEGVARLDGERIGASPDLRARTGHLPQSVNLPQHATVGELLSLFADLRGVGRGSVPIQTDFLPPDRARIAVLSGGQRHRVALAIALMGEPTLLLLDEPVASLDEEGSETFWGVLLELRDGRGVTAIVSSPSPAELRHVVDRAVYLSDGRIVLQETLGNEDPAFEGWV